MRLPLINTFLVSCVCAFGGIFFDTDLWQAGRRILWPIFAELHWTEWQTAKRHVLHFNYRRCFLYICRANERDAIIDHVRVAVEWIAFGGPLQVEPRTGDIAQSRHVWCNTQLGYTLRVAFCHQATIASWIPRQCTVAFGSLLMCSWRKSS